MFRLPRGTVPIYWMSHRPHSRPMRRHRQAAAHFHAVNPVLHLNVVCPNKPCFPSRHDACCTAAIRLRDHSWRIRQSCRSQISHDLALNIISVSGALTDLYVNTNSFFFVLSIMICGSCSPSLAEMRLCRGRTTCPDTYSSSRSQRRTSIS